MIQGQIPLFRPALELEQTTATCLKGQTFKMRVHLFAVSIWGTTLAQSSNVKLYNSTSPNSQRFIVEVGQVRVSPLPRFHDSQHPTEP